MPIQEEIGIKSFN